MNYSAFSLSFCISLSAFLVLWNWGRRKSGERETGVVILCTHVPVIVLPEETGLGSRPHVFLSSCTFLLQVQSGVSALHLSPPGRRTRPAPCLGPCRPSPSDGPPRPSSPPPRTFQNRRHEPAPRSLLTHSCFACVTRWIPGCLVSESSFLARKEALLSVMRGKYRLPHNCCVG